MANADMVPSKELISDLSHDISREVFANDLLREIIIEYFLHSKGRLLLRKCLKIAREVHPSWLQSATKIMRKYRQPVFCFHLSKENSTVDCEYFRNNGEKLLDRVMRFINDHTAQYTFSIKVAADYFDTDNCRSLASCLENAGENMVDLDITFPLGDSSRMFGMRSLSLPILQRLAIRLAPHQVDIPNENGCWVLDIGKFSFVQFLLSRSREIKEVLFDGKHVNKVRLDCEDLTMPQSIHTIYLDMPLKSSDLRWLLINNLPNLKSLRLFASEHPYEDELIFAILDKYKDQLTSLSLIGGKNYTPVTRTALISKLPVMKLLKFLWIGNPMWELQPNSGNLQECLPAIKEMMMTETRFGMLTKLTTNSVYASVESLAVSLVTFLPRCHIDVPVTPCIQKMRMLHISYPNIVSLEISLYCEEMSGLKYIFTEMTNLTRLIILLKGQNPMLPANHWDSLLIGAPPTIIESLRENRDFWPMFIPNDDNNLPSIRKLKRLEALAIHEGFHPKIDSPPLISEMAFYFGFFCMENLKLLALHGLFTPSEDIRNLWQTRRGTRICYGELFVALLKKSIRMRL